MKKLAVLSASLLFGALAFAGSMSYQDQTKDIQNTANQAQNIEQKESSSQMLSEDDNNQNQQNYNEEDNQDQEDNSNDSEN